MPHIKSNIDLEKSFGKFSTSYLSESRQLEIKIAKDAKIIKWLFIGLFLCLSAAIIGMVYTTYLLTL